MKNNLIKTIFILPVLALLIFSSVLFINSSNAQTKKDKNDWYEKLYEEDIKYEDFACEEKDKDEVKTYFGNHKLSKKFSVCHNDCPIVKCRPVIPFPSAAKTVGVSGTVATHILVNEEGRTIYARILSGHPLMWRSVRKAACETQFQEYERKHQGIMHFNINPDSDEIEVPSRANIVRQ